MARPPHPPGRLPFGLCAFAVPFSCGLIRARAGESNPAPWTAGALVDLAAEAGLSWLELPPALVGEGRDAAALRSRAERQGLRPLLAGGVLDAERTRRELALAAELEAPTLRCLLSGLLCGDRRGCPGGWAAHLEACAALLEKLLPEAERLGVTLALENHQDATSEELVALCRRFDSPYLGVALDAGNPLAVLEEPLAFARRVAPYLRHVHLKDYRIHAAPEGFRLVRCALGEGVVPLRALGELLDDLPQPVTRSLELAALEARRIPFLDPSWWESYPARDAREVLPALRIVWEGMRPTGEEWRTPFERGASSGELLAWEQDQLAASLRTLRALVD